MAFVNPFLKDAPKPGIGHVHLSMLPPSEPTFKTLSYTYPLKLVPSSPHTLDPHQNVKAQGTQLQIADDGHTTQDSARPSIPSSVPLLFMLSYGGGLLPPDSIDLTINLDPGTRLTIATQGSTKIFPSEPFQQARTQDPTSQKPPPPPPPPQSKSRTPVLPTATQTLNVHLGAHSALCLTPDPTQPFRGSRYHQRQIFTVHPTASLLLLDWTTEGRRARGESWDAELWRGCNEIWREIPSTGPDEETPNARLQTRLQLRDQVILEGDYEGPLGRGEHGGSGHGMRALREENMGCFGTLIALGELVRPVGEFFMREFEALPRVGGRDWGDGEKREGGNGGGNADDEETLSRKRIEAWRKERLRLEKDECVLWTSARVRGLVLVKFSARDSHGARRWLGEMLGVEGTVAREFGDGGMMCVR